MALKSNCTPWSCVVSLGDRVTPPPNQEMYHEGEGTKISKRRAGRWFLKAAEQGRREAQYNVAMMYHFGIPIAEKGEYGK